MWRGRMLAQGSLNVHRRCVTAFSQRSLTFFFVRRFGPIRSGMDYATQLPAVISEIYDMEEGSSRVATPSCDLTSAGPIREGCLPDVGQLHPERCSRLRAPR